LPRFFFNVSTDNMDRDIDGTELSDIASAKQQARQYAGKTLFDSAFLPKPAADWQVEVTDSVGLVLFRLDITMTDAPSSRP
jgi:hypothetical protein